LADSRITATQTCLVVRAARLWLPAGSYLAPTVRRQRFLRQHWLDFQGFYDANYAKGYDRNLARNTYAYLKDVLERLPRTTNQEVARLTPLNWQKARQAALRKAA
jgi:hypothetical protein